jgi:hypothetical protein
MGLPPKPPTVIDEGLPKYDLPNCAHDYKLYCIHRDFEGKEHKRFACTKCDQEKPPDCICGTERICVKHWLEKTNAERRAYDERHRYENLPSPLNETIAIFRRALGGPHKYLREKLPHAAQVLDSPWAYFIAAGTILAIMIMANLGGGEAVNAF